MAPPSSADAMSFILYSIPRPPGPLHQPATESDIQLGGAVLLRGDAYIRRGPVPSR